MASTAGEKRSIEQSRDLDMAVKRPKTLVNFYPRELTP